MNYSIEGEGGFPAESKMKFKPPLIGITTSGQMLTGNFSLPKFYVEAVRSTGGVPILIPPGEPNLYAILERLDGLIFSGGGDIDPAIYNGGSHPTIYNVDPERDRCTMASRTWHKRSLTAASFSSIC